MRGPDFQLRPATKADIPALARLWYEGWHEAHADLVPKELTAQRTENAFATRLERHLHTVTLAEMLPKLAGFVMVKPPELDQLYTAPHARGTGVATALLGEGERRLRDAGTTRAHLLCAIGNARAARFYEKSGWGLAGTVTDAVELVDGQFSLTVWRYEKEL